MKGYMSARRGKRRAKLLHMCGNKCMSCKGRRELELYHVKRNSSYAELSGAGLDKKWELVLYELGDCVLLCNPCATEGKFTKPKALTTNVAQYNSLKQVTLTPEQTDQVNNNIRKLVVGDGIPLRQAIAKAMSLVKQSEIKEDFQPYFMPLTAGSRGWRPIYKNGNMTGGYTVSPSEIIYFDSNGNEMYRVTRN